MIPIHAAFALILAQALPTSPTPPGAWPSDPFDPAAAGPRVIDRATDEAERARDSGRDALDDFRSGQEIDALRAAPTSDAFGRTLDSLRAAPPADPIGESADLTAELARAQLEIDVRTLELARYGRGDFAGVVVTVGPETVCGVARAGCRALTADERRRLVAGTRLALDDARARAAALRAASGSP